MRNLLKKYNRKKSKSFEEIIEFHYMFERIHPFSRWEW
ncbi:MAG: Fic family protein [Eubacterium sp.]